MAQLCDLTDDVLTQILAGAGARGIAAAGTSCRRLAALQATLARLPVCASAMSTLPVLEAAISDVADRALAGMLGPADFALIVVCNYSAPQKYARGKGMRHAVPLLLNHLQQDIPCIGYIGQGCMGVDAHGHPCEVDPTSCSSQAVSLLLGRLPGCRVTAFAAHDAPAENTWPELQDALGNVPPELLLLLVNTSHNVDSCLPDALDWLQEHLPATTPVAGGLASGSAPLYNAGSSGCADGAKGAAGKAYNPNAKYVGLAFHDSTGITSTTVPAATHSGIPPSSAAAAAGPSTGQRTRRTLVEPSNAGGSGKVTSSHAGPSTPEAAATVATDEFCSPPHSTAPGCTLAAAALSAKAMAHAKGSHMYQIEVQAWPGVRPPRLTAIGRLDADGRLGADGMDFPPAMGLYEAWEAELAERSVCGELLLWRTRDECTVVPLTGTGCFDRQAVKVEYQLLEDCFNEDGDEEDQLIFLAAEPSDTDKMDALLADGSLGRLCCAHVDLTGEANVRLLEKQLPALCDSVSAQGADQQAIFSGYYAAAARAAAAAGARSGRQALLAFSCVGRGEALYEGFGAQASEAQEACLMNGALAGQGPFWGAYVGGELGPQQLHGSGCGFAGICVEGGAEAGPVSHLAYSSVFVALGASPL